MTFLVCYGDSVVELQKAGLDKEAATLEAHKLMGQGYKNVRIRAEDPHHKTWPLNFDSGPENEEQQKEQSK